MTEPRVIPMLVTELILPEEDRERLGTTVWPVVAHAVVHRDGVFLFDTGMGLGNDEIDELFSPRTTPIERALADHGIDLAEVTGVANCHLHFDHAGQNVRLPGGPPIFVQASEWSKVHEPDYTVAEWVDAPGLRYEVVDGEVEVAPGLRLLPTPGHTPGHQSLVVGSPDGPVVLAGQAVQGVREWAGEEPSGVPEPGSDLREAYLDSTARLRALGPARVHFAHDPQVWIRPS
ncbi:MAG TPA: MBL fold metallo-hydrolase [Actinomycetota bacterium]|nr:MBL fold metallo-hydrolase [Actinomycetota bacterium]